MEFELNNKPLLLRDNDKQVVVLSPLGYFLLSVLFQVLGIVMFLLILYLAGFVVK